MEACSILRSLEDEERSSSTESGWTMYIGFSIHENDHYNHTGEYSYNTCDQQEEGYDKNQCPSYHGNGHSDDESDDSMASDASSGPSHRKLRYVTEQNLGMDHYKHDKKLHEQRIERDRRRNKIMKEKLRLKTFSAASHVQKQRQNKEKERFEPGRIGSSQISQSSVGKNV